MQIKLYQTYFAFLLLEFYVQTKPELLVYPMHYHLCQLWCMSCRSDIGLFEQNFSKNGGKIGLSGSLSCNFTQQV